MIQFTHVGKIYQNQIILKDLCLEINKGELVVLIGSSGCGKTTSLKMINRLVRPTSGAVLIQGENIEKMDIIALRRNIGYVIQQVGLFPHMTVRENIEIIPRLQKADPKKTTERTAELLRMVGLDPGDYLDRYPKSLSGGQQQRVGVARAFATDPDIILMDEPFSALDPITRGQLQGELSSLQAQLRKTIVFVTHDMDEAIRLADRICIINRGEIVQYDTPETILKKPADDFAAAFVGRNRIWAKPELIRIKDIMISDPVSVYPDVNLYGCIDRMRVSRVDSLMVIDRSGRLLGIVTAFQIQQKTDKTVRVRDILLAPAASAAPEDSMLDTLNRIDYRKIRTIPVLDAEGKLVGIVTKSALVTTLSQQYVDIGEE